MQSPIANSVFLASISPSLSQLLLSLPVFHLPFFHMTSPCTPHQFLLKTFLHSNLHSQLYYIPRLFLPGCFSPTWTISCCFSVSVIVYCAFVYAGAELSTFPLSLRELRLSPITPSTFLQAFALAVILFVTKAI